MGPEGWSPSESELPHRDPGLEMSKQRETQMINLMQLIPKGQTGFSKGTGQVSPSAPHSSKQPHPQHLLHKPGPPSMSPERDRTTPRAWRGHRCLQGPSAGADNIPLLRPASWMSRPSTSTPPGIHWESSFGMLEVRRFGGRQEVKNMPKGGASTSL